MQQVFRILVMTALLERILDPTGRLRRELREEQLKKREIRRVEDLSEDEYANYEAHPEEWLDVTERTIEDSLKMIGEAGIENCE